MFPLFKLDQSFTPSSVHAETYKEGIKFPSPFHPSSQKLTSGRYQRRTPTKNRSAEAERSLLFPEAGRGFHFLPPKGPKGGPGVSLALTKDFRSFERYGVIMPPEDVGRQQDWTLPSAYRNGEGLAGAISDRKSVV